jgi:uncharacterized protein (UPF0332 family)
VSQWLLDRLFAGADQPVPRFAFQGTINWMRALAILSDKTCNEKTLHTKYQTIGRRAPIDIDSDTCAFESILKAIHNLSALRVFSGVADKYDIVRSAIISWYYCIYFSSQAMIFATSNARPETHSKTDKIWHSEVVLRDYAVGVFGYYLKEIVPKTVKSEILTFKKGNIYDLNVYPNNEEMALGCVYAYLNGTARFEQDVVEKRIRNSREFKALNVNDFRKKRARDLRDSQLEKQHVNFLTQAFRYRGKANYRDSIYLSYGENHLQKINRFIFDLDIVAQRFLRMAVLYVNRRVEYNAWDIFITDIKENARININMDLLNC